MELLFVVSILGIGCTLAWSAPAKLVDPRDHKSYKTVIADGSVWMAENLRYVTKKSVCYENDEENCESFGRLYPFHEAKKACPKGWHLPNNTEIVGLMDMAERKDGAHKSGVHFKSRSGWYGQCDSEDVECKNSMKNGFDTFGLSVKPSGRKNADGSFESLHNYGFFWSGTEADFPFYFAVGYSYEHSNLLYSGDYLGEGGNGGVPDDFLPVRCVKGEAPREPYGWNPFVESRDDHEEDY